MEITTLILAIVATLIAVATFVWTFVINRHETKRKKFEFTYLHYNEILKWYERIIKVLKEFQLNQNISKEEKEILLVELSSLIDVGRFYFPNDKTSGFGKEKPSAYKGLRVLVLDLLVLLYKIFQSNMISHYDKVESIMRYFTSEVFDYLEPNRLRLDIKSYSKLSKTDNTIQNSDTILNAEMDEMVYKSNHNMPF